MAVELAVTACIDKSKAQRSRSRSQRKMRHAAGHGSYHISDGTARNKAQQPSHGVRDHQGWHLQEKLHEACPALKIDDHKRTEIGQVRPGSLKESRNSGCEVQQVEPANQDRDKWRLYA